MTTADTMLLGRSSKAGPAFTGLRPAVRWSKTGNSVFDCPGHAGIFFAIGSTSRRAGGLGIARLSICKSPQSAPATYWTTPSCTMPPRHDVWPRQRVVKPRAPPSARS